MAAAPQVATLSARGRTANVPTGLFIANEFIPGRGEKISSFNPADESFLAEVESASREDIDLAVAAARKAADTTWGLNATGAQRSALMNKFADLIERDAEELAFIETLDTGKGITWALGDIGESVACFRYCAGRAWSATDGKTLEVQDSVGMAFTRQEPYGVVAQIVPWNYPIMMWAWKVASALAAGCAIVFKPAELTPLATLKICELIKEAGYPAGAFNCVNSYGTVGGAAMASHPGIDKIAFTGSTPVGKTIAAAAAMSNLKKVGLELGGKSPNIVMESADLEQAAAWCCLGIFENTGQSCTGASRILVQESVFEKFLPLFVKKAESHQVGDPFDPKTYSGPLISQNQFDKVMAYVESGKKDGAKLLTGGKRVGTKGFFLAPTVFTNVTEDMKIYREEIFGPVAVVVPFKTPADAIRMANDTEYGLAAAIHTSRQDQLFRIGSKIKAGTIWLNQYAFCPPNVPFPPHKASGWGAELGDDGVKAYTVTKSYQWNYGQSFDWPFALAEEPAKL